MVAYLGGSILVEIIIVGDQLYSGVPDVLGGELASPLNKCDHDVNIPLQVWEESALT